MLLMHGIGGSARSCAALADHIADAGMQALCWDAAGYGESADPSGVIPADDPARIVLAVLDELGYRAAHLFGTSWGGVIAADTALRAPERVRSLTLADSTRGSATSPTKADAMRARIAELEENGAEALAAARAARLVSPSATPATADAVRTDMARIRPAGYGAAAHYMATTDLGDKLHAITVPTLVVVGEDDHITGVDESRLLAEAIPGARFALILGAGHAAVQERPAAMAAHVLPFLSAHAMDATSATGQGQR